MLERDDRQWKATPFASEKKNDERQELRARPRAAAHYYPLVAYLRFVSYTNMWYHHSLWQTGGGVDGG